MFRAKIRKFLIKIYLRVPLTNLLMIRAQAKT
jgi:hypothetical protein